MLMYTYGLHRHARYSHGYSLHGYGAMTYIVMACILMAYIIMAYIQLWQELWQYDGSILAPALRRRDHHDRAGTLVRARHAPGIQPVGLAARGVMEGQISFKH